MSPGVRLTLFFPGDSGKPVKDYSDLINPRVLPSDIVAETEDADTLDLSAGAPGTFENNRARSLDLDAAVEVIDVDQVKADDASAAVAVEEAGKLALGDGNDAIKLASRRRRRRRDAPVIAGEEEKTAEVAEEQYPDAQGVS